WRHARGVELGTGDFPEVELKVRRVRAEASLEYVARHRPRALPAFTAPGHRAVAACEQRCARAERVGVVEAAAVRGALHAGVMQAEAAVRRAHVLYAHLVGVVHGPAGLGAARAEGHIVERGDLGPRAVPIGLGHAPAEPAAA